MIEGSFVKAKITDIHITFTGNHDIQLWFFHFCQGLPNISDFQRNR